MSSVEAIFRPNDTLITTVLECMRENGHRMGERLFMALKLRVLSKVKRQELELKITGELLQDVNAGLVTLPVSASVVQDVLVSSWRDIIEWFLANWERILEFILAIIALF